MRRVAQPAYRRALLCWSGTRLLLLLWASTALPWFSHGAEIGDVTIYRGWAELMQTGTYPVHDPQWQYPPAAALIFLIPQWATHLGPSYIVAFFLFALAADFAVFTLLVAHADRDAADAREPGRGAHLGGVWAWVLGGLAIGPLLLMRYDVIVTALAVGGLVAPARSAKVRWSVRGALLGLGAMVKAWPAGLILGLPPKAPGRRAVAWAAGAAAVLTAALSLALTGPFSFLGGQSNRGIEVESALASPFMIASWFGYPVKVVHAYGSFQISGPGVSAVASLAELLTVLGVGIVLWWRLLRFKPRAWTPALMYDVALTVVLVLVVTSRVLSPQYLIWLLGLVALVFTENAPGRRATLLARPARLVFGCVLVTQIEFPLLFGEVMGGQFWGTMLVAVRNLVLVAACVLALRTLWHSGPIDLVDQADPARSTQAVPAAETAETADAAPASPARPAAPARTPHTVAVPLASPTDPIADGHGRAPRRIHGTKAFRAQ